MCMMMDKLRNHAAQCRALGQFTTADAFDHAADWIDALNDTHNLERLRIRELEAQMEGRPQVEKVAYVTPTKQLRRSDPLDAPRALVERLKQERIASDLSQAALARIVGCCPENIGKNEQAKGEPSLSMLVKWGAAFGLRLKWEDC